MKDEKNTAIPTSETRDELSVPKRAQYRTTTDGSVKWSNGHNAGCVFYAPDDACICAEVQREHE